MVVIRNRGPQFTPRGGVGSIYEDPRTKKKWKYTAQGWVEASTNIQEDVKEKGTFEIQAGEEGLVEQLSAGGSSDEQIQMGLAERRRVLSNVSQEQVAPEVDKTPDPSNPFGGMTKREMLRDAFNKGVADPGELEKLESLYDKLVGEEEMMIPEDLSGLSPEQKQAVKEDVRRVAVTKAQELGTGLEREGAVSAIATMESGQEILDLIQEGISTGPLAGGVRTGLSVFGVNVIPGKRRLGLTSEQEDELSSKMTIFTANFIKAISGTQVSDKEREFLMNALPGENKQEQENIEGIKAIADFLENRFSPTLGVDLAPLKPGQEDEEEDPLNIFGGGSTRNPLGI